MLAQTLLGCRYAAPGPCAHMAHHTNLSMFHLGCFTKQAWSMYFPRYAGCAWRIQPGSTYGRVSDVTTSRTVPCRRRTTHAVASIHASLVH